MASLQKTPVSNTAPELVIEHFVHHPRQWHVRVRVVVSVHVGLVVRLDGVTRIDDLIPLLLHEVQPFAVPVYATASTVFAAD